MKKDIFHVHSIKGTQSKVWNSHFWQTRQLDLYCWAGISSPSPKSETCAWNVQLLLTLSARKHFGTLFWQATGVMSHCSIQGAIYLPTWLRLSLPAPMGHVTERQAITAVSCRLVSFCSGSQRPPAVWCPMEVFTIIYRMDIWSHGRRKGILSACYRTELYAMILAHCQPFCAYSQAPNKCSASSVLKEHIKYIADWEGGQVYHAHSLLPTATPWPIERTA